MMFIIGYSAKLLMMCY